MNELLCPISEVFTANGLQMVRRDVVPQIRVQVLRARGVRAPAVDPTSLPAIPGSTSGLDPYVLWRAPDDWLIYSHSESVEALSSWASALRAEAPLISTDVSCASVQFELEGPAVTDILMRDCTLDLEGDAIATGCCAQTLFAQTTVMIHRPQPAVWRLFVERSVAHHVWEWLLDSVARDLPELAS